MEHSDRVHTTYSPNPDHEEATAGNTYQNTTPQYVDANERILTSDITFDALLRRHHTHLDQTAAPILREWRRRRVHPDHWYPTEPVFPYACRCECITDDRLFAPRLEYRHPTYERDWQEIQARKVNGHNMVLAANNFIQEQEKECIVNRTGGTGPYKFSDSFCVFMGYQGGDNASLEAGQPQSGPLGPHASWVMAQNRKHMAKGGCT